jgi:predicted nucleic acid-binding protein
MKDSLGGEDKKTKRLFDASAIVNLAINGGSKVVGNLGEGSALGLTFYEVGNSVWKLRNLLKKLSRDEAKSLLVVSLQLMGRLDIVEFDIADAVQIENIASEKKITFYDSAYLYAAKKNKLSLVTDDNRLAKAAMKEKIEAVSSSSL